MAASRTGTDPQGAAEPASSADPVAPDQDAGGLRWRRALRGALSLAVVAAIFYGLLRDTDLAEVGRAMADMTPLEIVGLLLLTLWNTVTYWLVLMSALPGLTLRASFDHLART